MTNFREKLLDYNLKGRKIMALRLMGLNDSEIGRAVGAPQTVIFGYRANPDIKITDRYLDPIDNLIIDGIKEIKKTIKELKKDDPITVSLLEGIWEYAEEALKGN